MFDLLVQDDDKSILPPALQNLGDLFGPGGSGLNEFAQSRIQILILVFFTFLIVAAIAFIMWNVLKYFRSSGDQGMMEEANRGVKEILTGVVVFLIGVVGIVLLFVFFGGDILFFNSYQTCISAPNSDGCKSCRAESGDSSVIAGGTGGVGALPDDWDTIKFASSYVVAVSQSNNGSGPSNTNQAQCIICEWQYFAVSRTDATGMTLDDLTDVCVEPE
jgi:hypothetical protein